MSESYRSDNEDVEEDVEQIFDNTETASEMLRMAREETGLSQKEVADQLFLSETFVRYIDDGEFQKIPKQPFVKGYLRSYARVVNLSGDDVVACYQKELGENADIIEPGDLVEESPGINNFTGPVLQTGLAGLAGLIVIVALVWWLVSDGDSKAPEPQFTSTTDSSTETKEPSANTKEPSADIREPSADIREPSAAGTEPSTKSAESGVGTVEQAVASTAVEVTGLNVIETEPVVDTAGEGAPSDELTSELVNDDSQSGKVEVERVTEAGTTYITVDAGGDDQVELLFSGDCWVEVQDARGASLYADLNHEGEVLKISGESPFQLLLGRASSVQLSFNNEGIDLGRYVTSDNTANVTLGE